MNKDYIDYATKGAYGDVSSLFSVSGDVTHCMEMRGCFGAFTKNFNSPKKCDVTVRMFPYDKDCKQLTAITPFDTDEIIEYLENLKRIFPFEFKINENEEVMRGYDFYTVFSGNKKKCYDITYSMDGPHIAYMFLLTMQRFLYAKDDCMYLALAFELKRRYEEFKKMNLFNILTCVLSTIIGNDRGGDMFYFNPSRFSYLWSSERLREHLLAKEELSRKSKRYSSPGVADLYSCNVYCDDSRLQRHRSSYPAQLLLDKNKEELDTTLSIVAANLRILREYNGYSGERAEQREKAIARNRNTENSNYYEERTGTKVMMDANGRTITGNTFDQSKIDAK